jgi:hypothetical protein
LGIRRFSHKKPIVAHGRPEKIVRYPVAEGGASLRARATSRCRFAQRIKEYVKEFAEGSLALEVVGDGEVVLDVVTVPSPVPLFDEIPGGGQIRDDPVGGSFGDAEFACDVDKTGIVSAGYEKQRARMVGEKAPGHAPMIDETNAKERNHLPVTDY